MAQAREYSVVGLDFMRCNVYRVRAGYPGTLLRVPRPAASSFTSAKYPGSLLLEREYA